VKTGQFIHSNSSNEVLGQKFLSTKNKIDGVFFSSEGSLLKQVSSKYHYQYNDASNALVVIGFARAIPDNEWEITLEDGQTLLLNEKEISIA